MNKSIQKEKIPKCVQQELNKIARIIKDAKKVLYFFDDDADGLSSFLQFYRFKKGDFSVIKGNPRVESKYISSLEKYNPDVLVILDKPDVDDCFLSLDIPVIWIDHHPIKNTPENVIYFNPLNYDLFAYPVSYISFLVTKSPFWLSAIGIIGDWQIVLELNSFLGEFDWLLLDKKTHKPLPFKPQEFLFNSNFSSLIRMFNLILKGKSNQNIKKNIIKFSQFNSPEEFLIHKTDFKELNTLEKKYFKLLDDAIFQNTKFDYLIENLKNMIFIDDDFIELFKSKSKDVMTFFYNSSFSFTGDLSNELLFLYPDKKLIIIAREKDDEFILSIRSSKIEVNKVVSKAIVNLNAQGGGHTFACGAKVHKDSFLIFLKRILEEL